MKMESIGDTLRISAVPQLAATNANAFRDWVRGAFANGHRHIEVDLSQATFVDSCGLGALVALHKTAATQHGKLWLVNPPGPVQQILELTRLDGVFHIVKR